jgi:hypothetical protein
LIFFAKFAELHLRKALVLWAKSAVRHFIIKENEFRQKPSWVRFIMRENELLEDWRRCAATSLRGCDGHWKTGGGVLVWDNNRMQNAECTMHNAQLAELGVVP